METPTLIGSAVVGLIVLYAVIYFAIHNAQEAVRQHLRVQTDLLVKMSRKAGVTESEIQEALNR